MKKYFSIAFLLVVFYVNAQNVIFNKVEKTHESTDKFLYKINEVNSEAMYLGEVEVQGFSNDDAEVFGKIYKKAKEIGANAYKYKQIESIDSSVQKFDPHQYKISLYYLPQEKFSSENNYVYLFSSSDKAQTISINDKKVVFQPRTYRVIQMKDGENYQISTRKLLGSSIKLAGKKEQPVQYFQISSFKIKTGNEADAGLNLKSGDINGLEKSYAQFLSMIYQRSN